MSKLTIKSDLQPSKFTLTLKVRTRIWINTYRLIKHTTYLLGSNVILLIHKDFTAREWPSNGTLFLEFYISSPVHSPCTTSFKETTLCTSLKCTWTLRRDIWMRLVSWSRSLHVVLSRIIFVRSFILIHRYIKKSQAGHDHVYRGPSILTVKCLIVSLWPCRIQNHCILSHQGQ